MAKDSGERVANYKNSYSLLLLLSIWLPVLALSHEAPCETGQASCSLQQSLGSVSTSFIRAHQSHVDVYSNSSGIEYKRKLQKRWNFLFWTLLNSFANTPTWASCLPSVHAEVLLGTGYIFFNFS